jgi:hypothetical protein
MDAPYPTMKETLIEPPQVFYHFAAEDNTAYKFLVVPNEDLAT